MPKLILALIHNNNEQRNAVIKPRLALLTELLEKKGVPSYYVDISYQPQIVAHTPALAFIRDVLYHFVDHEWLRYRDLRLRSPMRYNAGFLRKIFFRGRYSNGSAWRRSSSIETAVTDKHIRAWLAFLETDADFLICFEDDAVFKEDSNLRIALLLESLYSEYLDRPIYVDLAGGCALDALQIQALQTQRDSLFRHFKRPVTNTACAYLMSRSLVAKFHETLVVRPWLRLLGVDWMMNALMVHLQRGGINCNCMHADPTIFNHGSVSGEYAPWAR
jgi:hypothetical protein